MFPPVNAEVMSMALHLSRGHNCFLKRLPYIYAESNVLYILESGR
jgi:hypothetical protein